DQLTIWCDVEVNNDDLFISNWKTDNTSSGSSTSTQVKLPLPSDGDYDFMVNYGDGSDPKHVDSWDSANATHTYAVAGTYTIIISGTCKGFRFNNTGDRLKLLSIT